jgi:hypothetical protein
METNFEKGLQDGISEDDHPEGRETEVGSRVMSRRRGGRVGS